MSWLVQQTVEPGAMVTGFGTNAKFEIATVTSPG
jgi:hypothetical protein